MTYDPLRPAQPEPFSPTSPEPSPFPSEPVSAVPVSPVTPTATVAPAARRKGSGAWLNVVLVIAAAVAIGGVAFAVGRSTAPASAVVPGGGLGNGLGNGGQFPTGSGRPGFDQNGGGFGGLGRGGGITISGTVQSITGDKLTIQTDSGQTVELTLGSSTTYSRQQAAASSDVTTGSKVQVGLTFAGGQRPQASAQPRGVVGTANTVTVVP